MKKVVLLISSILCIFSAIAQDKGNILIKNGTVLTVTKGTLTETDVLVKDGKISQIGKNLSAPQGVKVIDAKGLFVMPGIIDAHSHIAIDGINEASSPRSEERRVGKEC